LYEVTEMVIRKSSEQEGKSAKRGYSHNAGDQLG